jgi:hypothetical protein
MLADLIVNFTLQNQKYKLTLRSRKIGVCVQVENVAANREVKKKTVLDKLTSFFIKYFSV